MWFNSLESSPSKNIMKELHINGLDLVVVNINDQLYCFENRCPHEDFKLSLGCIKNNQVKCPLHGYAFDLSSGICIDDDISSLNLYPVKLEDGFISVQLEKS